MNSQPNRNIYAKRGLWMSCLLLGTLGAANTAMAAANGLATPAIAGWNLLIVLFVFATSAGSVILNIAAIREWDRNWGLVSAVPIFGLIVWSGIIVTAKVIDPSTHMLWTLEIFAWAMINMIYMVTAMTAKRIFAKRDGEGSAPS